MVLLNRENLELTPLSSILISLTFYVLYIIITESKILRKKIQQNFNKTKSHIYWVFFKRLLGFIFIGLVPFILISSNNKLELTDFGLNTNNLILSFYWLIGLGTVILFIILFSAKKPENHKLYPELQINNWSYKLVSINSFSWIIYLLGYEFFFRGFLLFSCLNIMSVTAAISINVILYALVHIPKGYKESLGAIPFGILLCYITISTGNFLTAFLAHVIMALLNDYISLYFNPKMKIVKWNS